MLSSNYKMLKFFTRKYKFKEVEPPPDVKELFSIYSERGTHLSAGQLLRFLIEVQGEENYTLIDAERIVNEVLERIHNFSNTDNQGLTIDDFFRFLFFDDLNGSIISQVHHDMTAPLHHYFIYTGHNSYLTGNQLSSYCCVNPIIKALQRGVRVIELDLWPNSTKDDINVLHGRTLTSPVPLIKCLKSIKKYAFDKSPYPVIITLEDHLTPDLQAKVAEFAMQIFGKMLYYPQSESIEELPSPESLKNRILLSTKPPKEYLGSRNIKEKGILSPNGKNLLEKEASPELEADYRSDSDPDEEEIRSQKNEAPEYKRLIALHAGKPKKGLKDALMTVTGKVKRLSLSEQALEKAASSYGTDLVRFTQKNVLRIYPKGTRVTSSNYNPINGWMHGAQMVAFNMQGYGKSLWLMHGMFRSNGGCGYVKKPDFLMKKGPNNEVFDPKKTCPVKKTLLVKVYLADGWKLDFSPTYFDTYSPPDFYTKVYIVGVPDDLAKKKTHVKYDDWTPVWDEEFKFQLTRPELALLRIEVREHDVSEKDDFGGQTCLPVSELKTGIRSVPLYDKKGDKLKSVKLLMRFRFV